MAHLRHAIQSKRAARRRRTEGGEEARRRSGEADKQVCARGGDGSAHAVDDDLPALGVAPDDAA